MAPTLVSKLKITRAGLKISASAKDVAKKEEKADASVAGEQRKQS
jgi:hypothetical protein